MRSFPEFRHHLREKQRQGAPTPPHPRELPKTPPACVYPAAAAGGALSGSERGAPATWPNLSFVPFGNAAPPRFSPARGGLHPRSLHPGAPPQQPGRAGTERGVQPSAAPGHRGSGAPGPRGSAGRVQGRLRGGAQGRVLLPRMAQSPPRAPTTKRRAPPPAPPQRGRPRRAPREGFAFPSLRPGGTH